MPQTVPGSSREIPKKRQEAFPGQQHGKKNHRTDASRFPKVWKERIHLIKLAVFCFEHLNELLHHLGTMSPDFFLAQPLSTPYLGSPREEGAAGEGPIFEVWQIPVYPNHPPQR